MRHHAPIPRPLRGSIFTRAEAIAAGVSDGRLRALDILVHTRGIYEHLTTADQVTANRDLLAAVCRKYSGVRISHQSAASVWGLSVPERLHQQGSLHLSTPYAMTISLRDKDIRLHRPKFLTDETLAFSGMRLSSPLRCVIDLMPTLSTVELVILLDDLLRPPRRGLNPHQRSSTRAEQLQDMLTRHTGERGMKRLRQAVTLARVGADSPQETLLRLALVRGDLPEPELQIKLNPSDAFSPEGDMGYRGPRIVLQYEGAHHFTAEQQAKDQRRNAAFEAAGWTVVLVNRVDARENFSTTVRRVRRLLRTRP